MGIMCSVVKETGIVTFDVGLDYFGEVIYRITWWNGVRWAKEYYRSFNEARKTYKLISRMI